MEKLSMNHRVEFKAKYIYTFLKRVTLLQDAMLLAGEQG
jgi:hypothetical protein